MCHWFINYFSTTALVADSISNFGDLLSDGVVYYSVTEAGKKQPGQDMVTGKNRTIVGSFSSAFFRFPLFLIIH
jgi:hypothetical protein